MSGTDEGTEVPTLGEAARRKAIQALRENEQLRERVDRLEGIVEDQQSIIDELLTRTNTLQLIENGTSDDLTAETRRAMLVQYLRRKAERRSDSDRVSVDSEEWAEALHHPDFDRSTFTKDLKRAAERIDWDGLEYKDGVLKADFSKPLPNGVVTQELPEGSS